MGIAEVEALAESQFAAQGVKAEVTLAAPNAVTLKSDGKTLKGRLVVADGSLYLVPDDAAMPTVLLISPGSGNPVRVQAVEIGATDVTVKGRIDIESLLN
jgi:hypothetical protein